MSDWFRRNRARYPTEWEAIAARVKADAGDRCEACGMPQGTPGRSLGVDHLFADPENPQAVLIALCNVCHLRRHGLRPRPQSKEEAIWRLRRRFEIGLGQLCFPLSVAAVPPMGEPRRVARFSVPLVASRLHSPAEGEPLLADMRQLGLPLYW